MNQPKGSNFLNRLINLPADRLAWLWLLIGFVLLPFTAWQDVIPLAAWLAPVFLLRFVRTCSRPRLVGPLIFAAYVGALFFDLRHQPIVPILWIFGVIDIPLARGFLFTLPYLADHRIGPRLGSWGRMMLFPLAFTSVDLVAALLKSINTAGSAAYSQAGNLPLVQIVSVTGMWSLTFLIMWFASTVNALWEQRFDWRPVRGMLSLFMGVLVAVFLFGGLRLTLTRAHASGGSTQTIKVATVTNETTKDVLNSMGIGTFYRSDDAERAAVRPKLETANDLMFSRIETALQAGTRIVATQETSILALEEDRSHVLERASALARQYNAYLEISLWVFTRTQAMPYILNESVLIDPDGQADWTYVKTYPVFGSEAFVVISGPGRLPVFDTPYGRMSVAICNDMHYPVLLRQAGAQQANILFAPSYDDPTLDIQNPAVATYRAIENGVSLIRPDGEGLSMISDPEGRLLASQDYFTTDSHVLVATLPIRKVTTIYSRIGDLFAYLCVAGLVYLTGRALIQRRSLIQSRGLSA